MNILKTIFSLALLSFAAAILPDKCSVKHCGTVGASARCTQTHPFKVTTCAIWSKTREAALQCHKLDCSGMSCYFIPVLASDGEQYCTSCHIHQVSCRTGFKVYGPVDGPVSRQVEAKPVDEVKKVPVEVAEPAERKTIFIQFCSMKFCTRFGAKARCILSRPKKGDSDTTCFKFSFTPQSKEECDFVCPLNCLPEDQRPVANTGKKFCNECLLRSASCRANYKIFGPIIHPTIPPPTRTFTITPPTFTISKPITE